MSVNTNTAKQPENSAQKFSRTISTTRKEQIGDIQLLKEFISSTIGRLTLDDRKVIVEQALILLERLYVHLPLKRAMHAVDPVQRLRLVQLRLDEASPNQMDPESDFHREMINIFTLVRDLHTIYQLPEPFSGHFAFLPFQIESYGKSNQRQFLVTKIAKGYESILPPTFKPGVNITHWNGVPMQRAVEINANRNSGSNLAARFARGLRNLTYRPLSTSLPPDEEWVVIGYRTEDGLDAEHRQEWLVSSQPRVFSPSTRSHSSENLSNIGLDLTTELVTQMKKILFAPENVIEAEQSLASATSVADLIEEAEDLESTVLPGFFKARKISENVGYIRIFSFHLNNTTETSVFIDEFLRLIMQLPKKGLILDVRGNGGGRIPAAECLLQLLTPRKIIPEPYQFISSPFTIEMTRLKPWLNHWQPSLSESVAIGSTFSRGFPITKIDEANNLGQQYHGPVILVTDALCYSATDLFAAGFQDHQIGPVLGVDGNTGAGGANVWEHSYLRDILTGTKHELKALPLGSDMRVSIRRNVRVEERAGTPIEDLGITPDIEYEMTSRDLLEDNVDLIKKVSEILAGKPARQFDAVLSNEAGYLNIELNTLGVSRVDIYVDGRPVLSQDVSDGINKLRVETSGIQIELFGFEVNELVAARKIFL